MTHVLNLALTAVLLITYVQKAAEALGEDFGFTIDENGNIIFTGFDELSSGNQDLVTQAGTIMGTGVAAYATITGDFAGAADLEDKLDNMLDSFSGL